MLRGGEGARRGRSGRLKGPRRILGANLVDELVVAVVVVVLLYVMIMMAVDGVTAGFQDASLLLWGQKTVAVAVADLDEE